MPKPKKIEEDDEDTTVDKHLVSQKLVEDLIEKIVEERPRTKKEHRVLFYSFFDVAPFLFDKDYDDGFLSDEAWEWMQEKFINIVKRLYLARKDKKESNNRSFLL